MIWQSNVKDFDVALKLFVLSLEDGSLDWLTNLLDDNINMLNEYARVNEYG
jgi:hypothetical protein